MKIRHDAPAISSALLTVGLLALVKENLMYASTWREATIQICERVWRQNFLMPIGFASLTLIAVGLIVIWTGYIKGVRWAWFVIFIIVWVYVFPVHMLPVLQASAFFTRTNWSQWFWDTVHGDPIARAYAHEVLDFLLLAIAVLVPVRSFFQRRSPSKPLQ